MLLLKKLDLFGVNRKIKIEKVRIIFEELNLELKGIQKSIQENNMFNVSIKNDVKRMFEIFGKELKMNKELSTFLGN